MYFYDPKDTECLSLWLYSMVSFNLLSLKDLVEPVDYVGANTTEPDPGGKSPNSKELARFYSITIGESRVVTPGM